MDKRIWMLIGATALGIIVIMILWDFAIKEATRIGYSQCADWIKETAYNGFTCR